MSASHATTTGHAGIANPGSGGAVAALLRRGGTGLGLWYRRRRAIAALQALSDRSLEDAGIARSEIRGVVRVDRRAAPC
jgi:uncharacterized protein YjiS (DUF1127 family)